MTARGNRVSAPGPPRWVWFVVLAVILLTIIARVRLLSIPLERDEGEYAYAGQLILQGVPPYELVYNMKFPGIYYAYALVLAVFGQTQVGVHLGLLVVNAATILLVFLLGRRLFDATAGAWAAAAFALMSVSPSVAGVFAHATHFVLLPALGGLLLLLRGLEGRLPRLLLFGGVLFGTALLMKQHGAVFLILALLLVAWTRWRDKPADRRLVWVELAVLVTGTAIPLVATGAVLLASGVFGRFWLWTFVYASEYVSQRSWSVALGYLARGVRNAAGTAWPLWGLAAIGLALLAQDETWKRSRAFAVGFLVFSFLATVPGFYFRPHYFILLLPAIALLAGSVPGTAARLLTRLGPPRVFRAAGATALFCALVGSLALDGDRLFRMTVRQLSRSVYHQNPFPEALEVAAYLESKTSPGETIAVFGSEPEIFFYAGRRSATGYIYMYPLMERQKLAETMRQEMLREIETARPTFAVFVGVNTSWVDHSPSDNATIDRLMAYANANYDQVGLLEILSPEHTEVRWESAVADYTPKSPYRIVVLRRRDVSRD